MSEHGEWQDADACEALAIPGSGKARDRRERTRIVLAMGAFALLYGIVALRLVAVGFEDGDTIVAYHGDDRIAATRPDLIDRTGEILATDLKTSSLYAEPRRIIDPAEAQELLTAVLPELAGDGVQRKLASDAGFVWLKREITPQQQRAIHRLGIPGVGFLKENRRFYPGGAFAGHVLGHVNVDNQGTAGIEKHLDEMGLADLHMAGFAVDRAQEPVALSLDLRVQHALREELANAIERYRAIAAVGIVLDADTGEVVGLSSLPDYDPNDPVQALEKDRMNRAIVGVYEMGSTFKLFTTAMALDSGVVHVDDVFDATHPLRIGRHSIKDFHAKRRPLSVEEIFIYSSNIGTAQMALKVGTPGQQAFLKKLGLLDPLVTEVPETAKPMTPSRWTDIATATISFGHGLSVSPLQTAAAAAAMVNGGRYLPPTFLKRNPQEAASVARQVIKPETSDTLRYLMRLNVEKGSGRRADVPGYNVGGKTGTAEKVVDGRYANDKRRNAFLASFPMDDPRYVVLIVVDEPKPEEPGMGVTAGMNAGPTAARVIRRIAPMLGVEPRETENHALLVSYR